MAMFLYVICLALVPIISAHQVCYPRYGCFSDEPPFHDALTQLPWKPEDIGTTFTLFTRNNPSIGHLLNALNTTTITTSKFNNTKKTIMVIHGYIETAQIFWVRPMVKALLAREDSNVIVVNWGKGSGFPYHQAYGNARLVGAIGKEMIDALMNVTAMPLSKVHIIGFSMGAQVAGYIGRNFRREGKFISRITALDPAGPLYEYRDREVRLDTTDAEFIDVVHTDADTILIKGFGLEEITGHLDFYPNNGKFQPNCRDILEGPSMFVTCSHWRATMYFTESISSKCPFYGVACKNYEDFKKGLCACTNGNTCPQMGYDAIRYKEMSGAPIRYYMVTDGKSPFCVYQYRVILYTGKGLFQDLDASVKIIVTDTNGKQGQLAIKDRKLDSGSIEYFLATTKVDLGDLKTVKITHNALLDVWFLQKIVIQPLWKNDKYMGCYKRWLNSDKNTVTLQGVDGAC